MSYTIPMGTSDNTQDPWKGILPLKLVVLSLRKCTVFHDLFAKPFKIQQVPY